MIELLLVLAIIAAGVGVVVPRLRTSDRHQELVEAASTLAARTRAAQLLAVQLDRPTRVRFDADGTGYRIEAAEDVYGLRYGPADGFYGVRVPLADSVAVNWDRDLADENVLVFAPRGRWDTGRIELASETEMIRLELTNQPGVVRLRDEPAPEAVGAYDAILQQPL